MLTRYAYVDTNMPSTFQYEVVLKLKSCTVLHPLIFH